MLIAILFFCNSAHCCDKSIDTKIISATWGEVFYITTADGHFCSSYGGLDHARYLQRRLLKLKEENKSIHIEYEYDQEEKANFICTLSDGDDILISNSWSDNTPKGKDQNAYDLYLSIKKFDYDDCLQCSLFPKILYDNQRSKLSLLKKQHANLDQFKKICSATCYTGQYLDYSEFIKYWDTKNTDYKKIYRPDQCNYHAEGVVTSVSLGDKICFELKNKFSACFPINISKEDNKIINFTLRRIWNEKIPVLVHFYFDTNDNEDIYVCKFIINGKIIFNKSAKEIEKLINTDTIK
jgi:hypothetical protein